MRWPSLEVDYWELRSGEEAHAANPDQFWLPPAAARSDLRPGCAVKLIFDIEGVEEDGSIAVQGERMWVLVSEVTADGYFGILQNDPMSLDNSIFYLGRGAEVPFRSEHVVDLGPVPANPVQVPVRSWPRA